MDTSGIDTFFNVFVMMWMGFIWATLCVLMSQAVAKNQGWTAEKTIKIFFYLNMGLGFVCSILLLNR